VVLQIILLLKF